MRIQPQYQPLYGQPLCYFSGENALVLTLAESFDSANQFAVSKTQHSEDRFLAQQKLWAIKNLLEDKDLAPKIWQASLEEIVVGMLNITIYLKIEKLINIDRPFCYPHSVNSLPVRSLSTNSLPENSAIVLDERVLEKSVQQYQTALLTLWETIKQPEWIPKTINIPTYYGGEFGEDLHVVAEHNHLTESQVIELHSSIEYPVYFIGFQPGFPYLGGLSPKLFTPRRSVPRVKVKAGSVGIGGEQTGIYPFDSPGGWQIIGYTPFKLFDLNAKDIVTLRPGDVIRFVPQV